MFKIKKLVSFLLLSVICLMLVILLFRCVGQWMIVSDSLPDKLDVIFIFSGDATRDMYTQGLLKKYPSAQLIISTHLKAEEYRGKYWLLENDDFGKINFVDTCSNTRGEILFLKKWLKKNKNKNNMIVGLVSSPYHLRRILFLQNLYISEYNIDFKYLAVPEEYYGSYKYFLNWWKSDLVKLELVKLVNELLIWLFGGFNIIY